jgi:hypothetical protein
MTGLYIKRKSTQAVKTTLHIDNFPAQNTI